MKLDDAVMHQQFSGSKTHASGTEVQGAGPGRAVTNHLSRVAQPNKRKKVITCDSGVLASIPRFDIQGCLSGFPVDILT